MTRRTWTLAEMGLLVLAGSCGARSGLDLPSPAVTLDASVRVRVDGSVLLDATGPSDAASPRDATTPIDAVTDGVRSVDAGDASLPPHRDAGLDAGHDAGLDAGRDAGRDAQPDHASPPLVDAPRPLAPLSTSHVTRRAPTLRWVLPTGVTGAIVDLCRDRACTMPIGTPVTVTGASYTVASDLPVGVVYWRLHPWPATDAADATSATWEFHVGPLRAPIDTSWGTTLDVNGDGYADAVVGDDVVQAAYVYLGGASGLATTPAITLKGPPADADWGFGASVASAGDVNGDGYADLVVGAGSGLNGPGRAYVYLGSATGLGATPTTSLVSPHGGDDAFGISVASAGDVNGDGYADVVIGAWDPSGGPGAAYVYLGSAAGLSGTPATTLASPSGSGSEFGESVASAGDVNGDGYADVVVGAGGALRGAGSAYVYLGSSAGLGAAPASTLTGSHPTGGLGFTVASAGDVNGDGYNDLILSDNGAPAVYLGSATGISSASAMTLANPAPADMDFGEPSAGAGDVNGDGYADVVIAGGEASVWVFLGSATGISPMPSATLLIPGLAPSITWVAVASAGDVDGDGYADVIAGVYSIGHAFLYEGGPTPLATSPLVTLGSPPGVAVGTYGVGIFGASD